MNEVWVTIASPVITLAKAGFLKLLTELPAELPLTEPVAQEILAGPLTDPARRALEGGWGRRVTASGVPTELLTEWGLDVGETAAVAVALEQAPCTVVLDDHAARVCDRACGVPQIGTLGGVVQAKKRGLIADASVVMRALRKASLYLDDQILVQTLTQSGEKWSSGKCLADSRHGLGSRYYDLSICRIRLPTPYSAPQASPAPGFHLSHQVDM